MKKGAILFLFLILIPCVCAGELKVTQEHPFYVDNSWISAKQLIVGDLIQTYDGKKARITNIKEITENVPVYNLEDSYFHNYLVTRDNLIVHNSKKPIRRYQPARYPYISAESIYQLQNIQRRFLSEPDAPKIGLIGSRVRGYSFDTGKAASQLSDLDIVLVYSYEPCPNIINRYYNNGYFKAALDRVTGVSHDQPIATLTMEEAMRTNPPEIVRIVRENGGLQGMLEKGMDTSIFNGWADVILLPY